MRFIQKRGRPEIAPAAGMGVPSVNALFWYVFAGGQRPPLR